MKNKLQQAIHQFSGFDPGHLALKRSIKTFFAILISLIILYDNPRMAMLAAISALLLSRSQSGFTIQDRRFSMLTTGILMAVLSIPVSLISQNEISAILFLIIASFLAFFLIGSRVVPDFPVVVLLAMSVVEMAFSHTVESGAAYGAVFLLTTTLVYLIHFVIWPTRPRKRLRLQIGFMKDSLENYFKSITAGYNSLEEGIGFTHQKSDDIRKGIGDFRRLWHLFGIVIPDGKGVERRFFDIYSGLGKIHEFMLLMWQFRASAWDSALYHKLILEEPRIISIIDELIKLHDPDLISPGDRTFLKIQREIDNIGKEYLTSYIANEKQIARREWVAVINTIKALETLVEDLNRIEITEPHLSSTFSVTSKVSSFLTDFRAAFIKLKFSNPAVKLGIRSALIIGSTEAYSIFFEPDYGYWLVLFAVLLIRPNLGISIKAGKQRLLGTVAGALLAMGFVMVFPAGNPVFYTMMLLSVFLMIWFANLDQIVPMVVALTFMIICLFYLINPDESNLVWLRIFYTTAIVLLVIVLSFLLWPEKARKRFAGALAGALILEKDYFMSIIGVLISNHQKALSIGARQQIRNAIQQLNDVIEATKNEVWQQNVIIHGLNIRQYILRLLNTIQVLDSVSGKHNLKIGFEGLNDELKAFADNTSLAFDALIFALENQTNVKNFPALDGDFEQLRNHFREVKYKGKTENESIVQFWNNSTFIWNLKPLILELGGIRYEIELKMKGD
ncbi:MAG: FUSC family protein [Bacteroidales bacterium]|nr:FUSC family protein [Bacteroidales bacterium]